MNVGNPIPIVRDIDYDYICCCVLVHDSLWSNSGAPLTLGVVNIREYVLLSKTTEKNQANGSAFQ